MKQFTTPAQTAKLIELGFEKPKGWVTNDFDDADGNYSIGELMELLPKHIFPDGKCLDLHISANQHSWIISYTMIFVEKFYCFDFRELVDALCYTIIRLKEEGVI